MANFLPIELLKDIILRLPVKSLVRFKLVKKEWMKLISSTEFIDEHLCRSKTNVQLLASGQNSITGDPLTILLKVTGDADSGDDDRFGNLSLPAALQTFYEPVVLGGSCNGLLILRTKSSPGILFGNPATRKFKRVILPFLEARFSPSANTHEFCTSIGLCCISDSESSSSKKNKMDYKIIVIQNMSRERSVVLGTTESYPGWVYSRNCEKWKKLNIPFPHIPFGSNGTTWATVVNDRWLYWVDKDYENRIVGFDVKNEVVKCTSLPPYAPELSRMATMATTIRGSLFLIVTLENERIYTDQSTLFQVWEMKIDDSWEMMYTITNPATITRFRALGCSEDDRIVLTNYVDKLVSRHLLIVNDEKDFMRPSALGLEDLQVIKYVESLESSLVSRKRSFKKKMKYRDTSTKGMDPKFLRNQKYARKQNNQKG